MKNKFAAVLLAVAMTVFGFTSCEGSRYSVLRSGKSELYSVACVSVPFLKDDPIAIQKKYKAVDKGDKIEA